MNSKPRARVDKIEILVRAVHVTDGRLLVCHTKGADNSYLPGGHIDFGESADAGLKREIKEELGKACRLSGLLGVVEHAFMQNGERHHEMNLVFQAEIEDLCSSVSPESKEDYIEFLWVPLEDLAGSDLEPAPLKELIPVWLTGGTLSSRWASTV